MRPFQTEYRAKALRPCRNTFFLRSERTELSQSPIKEYASLIIAKSRCVRSPVVSIPKLNTNLIALAGTPAGTVSAGNFFSSQSFYALSRRSTIRNLGAGFPIDMLCMGRTALMYWEIDAADIILRPAIRSPRIKPMYASICNSDVDIGERPPS